MYGFEAGGDRQETTGSPEGGNTPFVVLEVVQYFGLPNRINTQTTRFQCRIFILGGNEDFITRTVIGIDVNRKWHTGATTWVRAEDDIGAINVRNLRLID